MLDRRAVFPGRQPPGRERPPAGPPRATEKAQAKPADQEKRIIEKPTELLVGKQTAPTAAPRNKDSAAPPREERAGSDQAKNPRVEPGKVRWRGRRGLSRLGHVTPNIVRVNGADQIVSGAGDVVQGFDPQTGKRIWSIYSQGEGVTPSLVIGDGLIFSCSGFEASTIRVVRTGGQGDVTKSHIAWEQKKGVPSLASMLYVAPHIFSVTDSGVVTCFTAKTGEIVWQNRIGGKHSSSPVYVDGKIYFLSEAEGECVIIEAGPEFRVIARNSIGEKCKASIAVCRGNLIIRSESHLFCIGDRPE
ncbi:MAG: PQQ-binding-like beta-propeller repeat protein [Chloroflexi bacterium]|nr:PQQ-binding-like beta-propeller repeat protein [Chloroflexota bacterium]